MSESDITDYDIITGTLEYVKEKVREMIREGWRPYGNVIFIERHIFEGYYLVYTQTMVK